MRTTLAYTSARIVLFLVTLVLLDLAGARGLLLIALALLISGLLSYVLLSRQRDAMAGSLGNRLTGRLRGGNIEPALLARGIAGGTATSAATRH